MLSENEDDSLAEIDRLRQLVSTFVYEVFNYYRIYQKICSDALDHYLAFRDHHLKTYRLRDRSDPGNEEVDMGDLDWIFAADGTERSVGDRMGVSVGSKVPPIGERITQFISREYETEALLERDIMGTENGECG